MNIENKSVRFEIDEIEFYSRSMFVLFILVFSISVRTFEKDMAWRSSGATHRELIENLFRNGLIKDQRVKEAMLRVDRADFTDQKSDAYEDRPQSSKEIWIIPISSSFDFLVGYAVSS